MFKWYANDPCESKNGSSETLDGAVMQLRKALTEIGGGSGAIFEGLDKMPTVLISSTGDYRFKEVRV